MKIDLKKTAAIDGIRKKNLLKLIKFENEKSNKESISRLRK